LAGKARFAAKKTQGPMSTCTTPIEATGERSKLDKKVVQNQNKSTTASVSPYIHADCYLATLRTNSGRKEDDLAGLGAAFQEDIRGAF